MGMTDLQEHRVARLKELLDKKYSGQKVALGRALGHKSGAFVRQMLDGERPITEKTVQAIEALPGCGGWFSVKQEHQAPHVSEPMTAYAAPEQTLIIKKPLTVGLMLQAISRATMSVPDKKKDAINSLASAAEITDADAALIDGIAGGVTVDLCVSAEQAEELEYLRLWKSSVFGLAQTWKTRADRIMLAEFLAEVDQLIREKYQVSSGIAEANAAPVRNPHK